ncbi:MAG: RNA 3'-terminal phosphate cyclase [Gemmatimonadota bacterium]|nr:RNA 3'-terminal phosphate cyclase [Gemmatimonadota bacterium]
MTPTGEIEIDGAEGLGSGTILRYSVALAALQGRPLRLVNARAGREKPGLRPQHLAAIAACAELCGAETEGLAVDSTAFRFRAGRPPEGGEYRWEIPTAGSTTMLALTVLPLAAWADGEVRARIVGGVFQDFAPSPFHLSRVLAPLLARVGLAFSLELVRPGYVPGGEGEIELAVTPVGDALDPVVLDERGPVERIEGIALSSHLEEARVSERMAEACEQRLAEAGLDASIEPRVDDTAVHPGAGLAAWAITADGHRLGSDRAGARGRPSERIGAFVADRLLEDLETGAPVDRHAADMLVLFAALATGESRWPVPRVTDHLRTNLRLIDRFGIGGGIENGIVRVEGAGHRRHGPPSGRRAP